MFIIYIRTKNKKEILKEVRKRGEAMADIKRDYIIRINSIRTGILDVPKKLTYFVNDKNTQNLYLIVGEDTTGLNIELAIRTPYGENIFIKPVTKNENKIGESIFEYYVETSVVGKYMAEFHTKCEEKISTSFPFSYTVENNYIK